MTNYHFPTGIALTGLLALLALLLTLSPWAAFLGPLSLAMILGLLARSFLGLHPHHEHGVAFSAKSLLRLGVILLGVRLDFHLMLNMGYRILVLDLAVVTFGCLFIYALGRWMKLEGGLPILIAVGSSICGASAVAAAAPVVRAKDHEMAIAIPLCTLLGTAATLGLMALQTLLHLAPSTYGVVAGSTLHEVAHVMAAASFVPGALQEGAVTKLTRVLLLVPVLMVIGAFLRWTQPAGHQGAPVQMPWFVAGFFALGLVNTGLLHLLPAAYLPALTHLDQGVLMVANGLMAMAMAGLGLQTKLSTLTKARSALLVAVFGWFGLVVVACLLIHGMGL